MKISEQPKAPKREDGFDFISNMLDHILLLILSRLPSTEEVIRTSILSTRWRYLWTSVPSVQFLFPENKVKFQDIELTEKNLIIDNFKEFVYWVLLNRSADLDKFTLICLDDYNMPTIWRWIHAAVARNVKQLDLWLEPQTEVIEMPHSLVACRSLTTLKLSLFSKGLRLPNYTGFPALRVLELSYLDLLEDEASVKAFFENCPLLEDLSFELCLMNRLNLLCISCAKLKKLKFINDEIDRMGRDIRISCPKLVDLDITGFIAHNIFLESLDSLKQAVIVPTRFLPSPEAELIGSTESVLFPGISHVESLWIDLYFFSQCIYAARDRALPNLKILVLTTTIDEFTVDELNHILNYYPKLESLKLIVTMGYETLDHSKLDEAAMRSIWSDKMTPDLIRVEFLEFNGEKPKLVIEKPEVVWVRFDRSIYTYLKMVLSWGN